MEYNDRLVHINIYIHIYTHTYIYIRNLNLAFILRVYDDRVPLSMLSRGFLRLLWFLNIFQCPYDITRELTDSNKSPRTDDFTSIQKHILPTVSLRYRTFFDHGN